MNSTFPSGLLTGEFATGGAIAILAIVMVFVVLLVIIIVTELIGKVIASATKQEPVLASANSAPVVNNKTPLDINDEDATVAALIASIDYRNETNMNIKVVSVKEVK